MVGRKIIPEADIARLGDLISYLLIQRRLGKPVVALHRILSDVRRLILRMTATYYTPLPRDHESWFIQEIIDYLGDIREDIICEGFEEDYSDYCIREVISAFEHAAQLKYGLRRDPDRPADFEKEKILESFDLNLRPSFRLVKSDSTRTIRSIYKD